MTAHILKHPFRISMQIKTEKHVIISQLTVEYPILECG